MRLTAENITKSFGAKQVLKGIDLSVESGRALGLLGRNGAGKTTMIRIVMQVFQADSGRVLIDGKPMDVNRVRIGYLPEERGLYPKKLIMEQLLYFAALQGVPARQAKKGRAAPARSPWHERICQQAARYALKGQPAENSACGNAHL